MFRYHNVLQLDLHDHRALNNLGAVLALQHRHSDAEAVLRRAVTAAPNSAAPLVNLADLVSKRCTADAIDAASALLDQAYHLSGYALCTYRYLTGRQGLNM